MERVVTRFVNKKLGASNFYSPSFTQHRGMVCNEGRRILVGVDNFYIFLRVRITLTPARENDSSFPSFHLFPQVWRVTLQHRPRATARAADNRAILIGR
jgi:hypothetical protein